MAYACVCRFAYPWRHGWKLEVDVRCLLSLSTILFYLDVCMYVYAYVYIPVHCLLSLATLLPWDKVSHWTAISARLAGQWAPQDLHPFPPSLQCWGYNHIQCSYSQSHLPSLPYCFHFLKQGLFHCTWSSLFLARLAGQEVPGSSCLYHYTSSFSLEFQAYTAMPGFTWLLGIQIQVLTCAHHSLLSISAACNQSSCE